MNCIISRLHDSITSYGQHRVNVELLPNNDSRDGPLEILWGRGGGEGGRAKYQKKFVQGKIKRKKIHARQLTLRNIHATA